MGLIAMPARTGNWLDTDVPLSDAVLADVAAAGYQGVFRYVPLPSNSPRNDISLGELARICSTRRPDGTTLQCGLIQHPRKPENNDLSAHAAYGDAHTAADFALGAGYPTGAHLGLDFEGLLGFFPSNTRELCIGWADDWQAIVRATLLKAQLYNGFDVPLSPEDLYDLHGFDSYWLGLGGEAVATRSHALRQGGSVTIHGIEFDRNVLAPDKLGGVPFVAQLAA